MKQSVEKAQEKAAALGLTGARAPLAKADRDDPKRLFYACVLVPVVAMLWALSLGFAWAVLAALPASMLVVVLGTAMRRYFIAFSPQNAFPRNLPAFARWAALYAGVMLTMIALPPDLTGRTRGMVWCALAAGCLLFPLAKAYRRARHVWE